MNFMLFNSLEHAKQRLTTYVEWKRKRGVNYTLPDAGRYRKEDWDMLGYMSNAGFKKIDMLSEAIRQLNQERPDF